ncbi:MAG: hypothetical protein HFG05_04360 [Oscillibacter sp.]|nr:hypothetical protein [Oscillibacter sp.]
MDKMMKRVLKYLNRQKNPSSHTYNLDSDLEKIASAVKSDKEAVRHCIRCMEKYEYINWISNQHGTHVRFSLDHKGLLWKEYRWKEIGRYLADKWIDCLALLVALISLGFSLWSAFWKLP